MAVNGTQNTKLTNLFVKQYGDLLRDLRLVIDIYIYSDTYPKDQLLIIKFLTEARHMQNETEKE